MPFVATPPSPGRCVFPFQPPVDLTPYIAMQDPGWVIESKLPALWMVQDPGGANSVAEVMCFEYGTRGFPGEALARATTGPLVVRHRYKFRAYWNHLDAIDGPNSTMHVGIRHGSYPLGVQPYPATLTNTLSEIRVRLNDTPPWGVELVWCPGGGAGKTTQLLTETVAYAGEGSAHLELVVDYSTQTLEGYVNGKYGGSLAMTGWNGTRLPGDNILGKKPWMSLYGASGNDAAAQIWYSAWSGIEMEIAPDARMPYGAT